MSHVPLPDNAPGIVGPMLAYPRTGQHIAGLAEALLRGPSSLTRAEREIIATYVSSLNDCDFCSSLHSEVAKHSTGEDSGRLEDVLRAAQLGTINDSVIDEKMQSLLVIAERVWENGHLVSKADISNARVAGADDQAIHDTVLTAAMFSMINRYIDGLAAYTPTDPKIYELAGASLAERGFLDRIRWDLAGEEEE